MKQFIEVCRDPSLMDCSSSFEEMRFPPVLFPELVSKLEFSEGQRNFFAFFLAKLESFYGLVLPHHRVDICEECGV